MHRIQVRIDNKPWHSAGEFKQMSDALGVLNSLVLFGIDKADRQRVLDKAKELKEKRKNAGK